MSDLLVTTGLTVGYGGRTLLAVPDLAIAAGALVVSGGNGCGKSTLLRTLAGALPPVEGTAAIAGCDLRRDPLGAKRQLGYLADELPVPGATSISELLDLVAWTRALPRDAVTHQLARVGLAAVAGRRLDRCSLGQQRRACLAASLLGDPAVLLLDEPETGMDRAGRDLLREEVATRTTRGWLTVIVTHDPDAPTRYGAEFLDLEAGVSVSPRRV